MDVSELLAPGPGLSTATIVIIAVAIFGACMAIAGKLLDDWKPDNNIWENWVMAPGVLLFVIGGVVGAIFASEDQPDHVPAFKSVLFEGYGFNTERPASVWGELSEAGETGTVTKVSREGVEQDVRIHIEGNRLVITGVDGMEIPTNAQLIADGSK